MSKGHYLPKEVVLAAEFITRHGELDDKKLTAWLEEQFGNGNVHRVKVKLSKYADELGLERYNGTWRAKNRIFIKRKFIKKMLVHIYLVMPVGLGLFLSGYMLLWFKYLL